MMDFLRALAPSHTAAKTRAVPVVRSRFEDGRPLALVPTALVETPPQDVITGQRDMVEHHRAIIRSVEPAHVDDTARDIPAARHVVTPPESRVTLSQVPELLPEQSTSQPLSVRAVPETRTTAERAERVSAVPRAIERPIVRRAAQPVTVPLQTAALPVGLAMPETAGSPPAHGPLSSSAIAARTESRPDTRPVIHVTIDRIDVRAPSVPERAASRPRSRSTTSASLNDYLRSRQSSRSGGTS